MVHPGVVGFAGFSRRSVRLAVAVLALFVVVNMTQAQDAPVEPASAEPGRLLADQLVVLMHESLAGTSEPRDDQVQRARILLDMALALTSDDAELWRLRMELAGHMRDAPARLEALRQYVRLRPTDDAAQLDLILARLEEFQTLEQRFEQAERVLQSEGGRRLSASLRSRMASYAAAAAAELGHDDRYATWLQQAHALDPVNFDAARMTYQLTLAREAGPGYLGVAMTNLVRAAPASPELRLEMAQVLLSLGVYGRAADQFDTASLLSRGPLPVDAYAGWALSLAAMGSDSAARALLSRIEYRPEGAYQPGDPVLPVDLELLRLALLDDEAYQSEAAASFERLVRAVSGPDTDPSADEPQVNGSAAAGGQDQQNTHPPALHLAWMAAVMNQSTDRIEDWLVDMSEQNSLVRRARGWAHLRAGEVDAARQQFEPIAATDGLAALGLALMLEQDSERAQELTAVMQRWPGELAGLMAARALRAMNEPVRPSRAGFTLAGYMDRFPAQLWQPALTVSPWLEFHITVEPPSVSYLEPIEVTLTMRNASRMPLSLDSGQGAPSRVMLIVEPRLGGDLAPWQPQVVVEMGRRLTLEPQEQVQVVVWLDRSELGRRIIEHPDQPVTYDLRAVLGPQLNSAGQVVPQPVGAVARARAFRAGGQPATAERVEQWLRQATESGSPDVQLPAAARLLQLASRLPQEVNVNQVHEQLAASFVRPFAQMDAVHQAWLVRFTPTEAGEPLRQLLEQAVRSDDPMVRVVHLATHVREPNSPALTAALRHRDRTIRAFAEALRDGLAAEQAAAQPAPPSE